MVYDGNVYHNYNKYIIIIGVLSARMRRTTDEHFQQIYLSLLMNYLTKQYYLTGYNL